MLHVLTFLATFLGNISLSNLRASKTNNKQDGGRVLGPSLWRKCFSFYSISRSNGGRGRQGEKRGGRDKFGVEIGSSLLYFLLVALSLDDRQFLSLMRFVSLNLSFSLRRDCSGGCSSFKTTSSPSSTCMDAILFIYMTSLPREVRIDFWKGVARKIGRDTVTRANFLKIRHFMFHVTRQPTFKATSLREKSR